MDDNKKLNLPAIRKIGAVTNTGKPPEKTLTKLDLNKKTAVASIIKAKTSSVEKEIINNEKGLDLVLVGDLTASMTNYHQLLKNKFSALCSELFPMIKNLRIGIIFYLDHYNGTTSPGPDNQYITKFNKLTTNTEELLRFINMAEDGNGYDWDEAVEDALNDLLNMNWKDSNSRSVVIFGDASPHNIDECPFRYDFWETTHKLFNQGTTINSVFCNTQYYIHQEQLQILENVNVGDFSIRKNFSNEKLPNFFSWIANVSGGMVIGVEKIDDLVDIIMAAAAKDSGHLDELEEKIKKTAPNKLNLIEIAKKAEQRKRIGGNSSRRLEPVLKIV
jgi:vacuolar-type H+-ATPase subunit D/Vma8